MTKFLQIHTLTSYPATLLNRDDAGFAKRLPFGGAKRTRVSSQCLKHHWRTFTGAHSLHELTNAQGPVPFSVRSRETFERLVRTPLVEAGVDGAMADRITTELMNIVLGKSEKSKAKPKDTKEVKKVKKRAEIHTNQVVVLGEPEIAFLVGLGKEIAARGGDAKAVEAVFTKEQKANLKQLALAAGLDAALFGRMVTSDILARGDAAIHVAHAFTVHRAELESDYFSAIDELTKASGELGSGHINATELTSGLYYGYVVVDVDLLVKNLSGDRDLARGVVERLVHLMATVSPGAKLGATAPYARANLVLVEAGDAQPRTAANAFLKPVAFGEDVQASAYKALATYLREDDGMYGPQFRRALSAIGETSSLVEVAGPLSPLATTAAFAAGVIS